ncbi:hypothetical protein [Tenacibaculum sp. M341]|uniref:hypothetical protein n=1 Tax=Tenacibaculum sp. M341 TaxID=2530339 RepID=UPI001052B9B6|nr:hypothetical protein [Tenacibaculum sp. M341]TCI93717.1 hypothetical protein EYW44_04690 [Tenacibaculum sp. M341]
MRTPLAIIFLLFSVSVFSQISVNETHNGGLEKVSEENFERFKNSKTIFILSNAYETDVYKKILDESWSVTPYVIVNIEDFDVHNYLCDSYSFVDINTINKPVYKADGKLGSDFLYLNLDTFIYNVDKVKKKLAKLKNNKKKKSKIKDILDHNRIRIARIYLSLDYKSFSDTVIENPDFYANEDNFKHLIYSKNIFNNYKPGFLKNYLQKVNNLLVSGESYSMYKDDYLPELKELSTKKLYIPEHLGLKLTDFIHQKDIETVKEKRLKKIFEKYEFDYEIIDAEKLSHKIINDEELYYARYHQNNTEGFFQITNSKTGEVIYRDYLAGLSPNLKAKQVKKLVKSIKKSN